LRLGDAHRSHVKCLHNGIPINVLGLGVLADGGNKSADIVRLIREEHVRQCHSNQLRRDLFDSGQDFFAAVDRGRSPWPFSLYRADEGGVGRNKVHEGDESADFARRVGTKLYEAFIQAAKQVLLSILVPLPWGVENETEENAGQEGSADVVGGGVRDGFEKGRVVVAQYGIGWEVC
jgi:hypothetical protein